MRSRVVPVLLVVIALLPVISLPVASSQESTSWPSGRWSLEGEWGRDDDTTSLPLHTEGFTGGTLIVAEDGTILEGSSFALRGVRVQESPVDHAQVILSFRGDELLPTGSAASMRAVGDMRIVGEVLAEVTGSGLVPVPIDYQGPVTVGLFVDPLSTCASVAVTYIADFAAQVGVPVGFVVHTWSLPETVGTALYALIKEIDIHIYESIASGEPIDVALLQDLILFVDQLNAAIARARACDQDLGDAAEGGPAHIWLERMLLDALGNLIEYSDQVSTDDLLTALATGVRGGALTQSADNRVEAVSIFHTYDQLLAGRAEEAVADGDEVTQIRLYDAAIQYGLPETKKAAAP